jgi:hypothetical protein
VRAETCDLCFFALSAFFMTPSPQLRRKNRALFLCLLAVIVLFYGLSYVKFGMAARNTPAETSVLSSTPTQ